VNLKETIKKFFHLSKKDEFKYPCKECLVLVTCSKLCDKIEMNDDVIFERIKKEECCPDCGGNKFSEGPCGGISQHMRCATCRHKFNFSLPVAIERIT